MGTKRIAVAIAVAAVSLVLAAATASAHARYKESTPGKGQVLQTAPAAVSITYTNDIQKISGTYDVTVSDADGASVTSGPTVLDETNRSRVSVPLRPALAPGRYEVHWSNISDEDGDPALGAFSFYVGAQPTAENLIADAVLDAIGLEEETPQATAPATAAATAPARTPAASKAAPTSTPSAATGDGGGGSNTRLWIIVAAIVVAVGVTGFVGWQTLARRQE